MVNESRRQHLLADVVTLLPADDEFLRRVLAVPAEASATNLMINEAHQLAMDNKLAYSGREQTYIEAIHDRVQKFAEQCQALEQELDRSVGAGLQTRTA